LKTPVRVQCVQGMASAASASKKLALLASRYSGHRRSRVRLSRLPPPIPQSRKILAEILKGVPDDEQARIAGDNTARVYTLEKTNSTACATA
jgi:hypothetical protein